MALPRALPRAVGEALQLYRDLGLTDALLPLGRPARKVPTGLPPELAALYRSHGRVGDRIVVPPGELRSLHTEMKKWVEGCEADGDEPDSGRVSLTASSSVARLLPIGKSASGDFFFMDPALVVDGMRPVLRHHHDEGLQVSVEASSLGSYLAGVFLRALLAGGLTARRSRSWFEPVGGG